MEEKKQHIVERASELFHQYGIRSVSMDDISREVGISKKTLYQFVKDKTELVESTMEYLKKHVENAISAFYDTSINAVEQHYRHSAIINEKFMRTKNTLVFDLKKYYPLQYEKMRDLKRSAIYEAHLANLEHGKKGGYYRPEINSHIIAKMLLSFYLYTFDPTSELFTENELIDISTFKEIHEYHFRGICTPKGIDELERLFCNK